LTPDHGRRAAAGVKDGGENDGREERGFVNRKTLIASTTVLATIALTLLLAGSVLATPASGTIVRTNLTPFPPGTTLAQTDLINAGPIKFQSKADTTVVFQQVVYSPAADSGWHLHPGVVFVSVNGAGAQVTRWVGCSSITYSAGQTFIESAEQVAGKIVNTGSVDATLYVMYVVPAGSPLSDPTAPAPAC
jgi:hypothetical protein